MLAIHPNARTAPAVRAELARSGEPTGVLATRHGVSTETIRKWRKRGPGDCLDRSARPHKLPRKTSEEERAVVCALRRATGFPLDDLTFVVRHFRRTSTGTTSTASSGPRGWGVSRRRAARAGPREPSGSTSSASCTWT
jgi:hypothetical protein